MSGSLPARESGPLGGSDPCNGGAWGQGSPVALTRVALVEDDPATRSRFERVIRRSDTLQLVRAESSVKAILAWLVDHPVDILLVDLGLPDGSGIDVISWCQHHQPAAQVMVITMFGDEANMMKAFTAGANGYLLKDGTEEDLAAHIVNLRNGGTPLSPIIARQLLDRLGKASVDAHAQPAVVQQAPAPSPQGHVLSPKEFEVLQMVARGLSYPEVAGLLKVSVSTIHTHVKHIYLKLSVRSKAEAVFEARQMGLLKY